MKSTLLVAGALVGAAATLLLAPASAKLVASQSTRTPNATFNAPETAKAPSWQRVAYDMEGHYCSCGKTYCDTAVGRFYVCKSVPNPYAKKGDPPTCKWHSTGACAQKKR